MAEMNFAEFQMKVLRGIGYSNISTTNRAYQWIKNNSSIDGPCLNYLKNYISEENFITQKEMNLFKQIINNKQIPVDEREIDNALSEFYCESGPVADFSNADISYVENELEKAESRLKELEFTKRLLQRQYNKVQDEINVVKNKNQSKEIAIENILQRSKKVDDMFEDASRKLQSDLINMGDTFHKLVAEGAVGEEHSIFTINFEIFKKINCTFRDTVDHILDKQFRRISKSENENQTETSGRSFDEKEEIRRKAEDLILVAASLGQRTYDSLEIKCEEAEFNELSKFLDNLKSELKKNEMTFTGIACLQAQTSINNEAIEDLKSKSEELQNILEKYHKNNILQELFTSEKFKLEQKLKCDRKCIRKISDLCSKYIDLITLQACFLENEKENVTLAVDLYNRGFTTLQTYMERHTKAMGNLEKHKNRNRLEKCDNSFMKFALDLLDLDETDLSIDRLSDNLQKAVCDVRIQILSLVSGKLKQIRHLHTVILDLDKIVFNGPSKQPFYIVDLLADKRITELQYVEYNKIYRGFKAKYLEEVEKLNNDQYLKMQKLLWIMFLTNPQALQDNLQQLRRSVGAGKNSTMKRAASLFSLIEKGNETNKF